MNERERERDREKKVSGMSEEKEPWIKTNKIPNGSKEAYTHESVENNIQRIGSSVPMDDIRLIYLRHTIANMCKAYPVFYFR